MIGLFQSNLVQVLATFLCGVAVYIIGWGRLWGMFGLNRNFNESLSVGGDKYLRYASDLIIILLFIITLFCFLFSLGEFYQYSYFYKRSFGYFGDSFPFAMILFVLYALNTRSIFNLSLCLAVIIMNGSKIALILSIAVIVFKIKNIQPYNTVRAVSVAILIYWSALIPANYLLGFGYNEIHPPTRIIVLIRDVLATLGLEVKKREVQEIKGGGACSDVMKCFSTQVENALKQRIATGVAGLWMTAEGGYHGARFPGTAEKFADLMMTKNPWGVNDIFGMTRERWIRTGGVQIAFLHFSSGYGPLGLLSVVLVFCGLSVVAVRQLESVDTSCWRALSSFFILLVFCNQSQPWLQGGSLLLFVSGIAATHIAFTSSMPLFSESVIE